MVHRNISPDKAVQKVVRTFASTDVQVAVVCRGCNTCNSQIQISHLRSRFAQASGFLSFGGLYDLHVTPPNSGYTIRVTRLTFVHQK